MRMLLKIFMGMMFFIILIMTQAHAAPNLPLEGFVIQISKQTQIPEEKVRDWAVEELRRSERYSEVDLKRLKKGASEQAFDRVEESAMVRLLQNSASFKVRTGLEQLRLDSVFDEASGKSNLLSAAHAKQHLRRAIWLTKVTALKIDALTLLAKGSDKSNPGKIEIALIETRAKLHSQTNALLPLVTNFFKLSGIKFKLEVENGDVLVELHLDHLPNALRTEALRAEGCAALCTKPARPRVTIDLTRFAGKTHYSWSRNIVFIGFDSLASL